MFESGGVGYLLWGGLTSAILSHCLAALIADDIFLTSMAVALDWLASPGGRHPGAPALTASGQAVLQLLADGLTNRAIAGRVGQGDRYEDRNLIFCTHQGHPLGWRTVDRDFARILTRGVVTAIMFHEARHTYATIALKHGIPAKVVQERLGHSDIGVTLDIYSHVTPGLG